MDTQPFSTKVLNAGFIVALILSGVCLIFAAWYMISFQSATAYAVNEVIGKTMAGTAPNQTSPVTDDGMGQEVDIQKYNVLRLSLSVHMYTSRIQLLSCGIFVGLAFGFLGFCLFLIGIKGDVNANLEATNMYKLQLARLSPGLFVLFCSTVLIGLCATRSLPVKFSEDSSEGEKFELPLPQTKEHPALNKIDPKVP